MTSEREPGDLPVDPARLEASLSTLSAYAEPAVPGWTRQVFSEPYLDSRSWVRQHMADAGLHVSTDGSGNIVGVRKSGEPPGRPAIVLGSHTDTVIGGGRFDGVVGVLGAIEAARVLAEQGVRLRHDLRVVDFFGEEANVYGASCLGSRALAGKLSDEHLGLRRPDGQILADAYEAASMDPSAVLRGGWHRGEVAAFVELHIEQGPRLERLGKPIGVVTDIAGIHRLLACFTGRADHAGTMPMGERRDALAAAAEATLTIERCATCAGDPTVATTGRLESHPGALNVVPSSARLWAELRSVDTRWLDAAERRLTEEIAEGASRRGVQVELSWLSDQAPVSLSSTIRDEIAAASEDVGLDWAPVPSGAGHDAAYMADLGPTGMIFVPSAGGKSHCPEEWTDLDGIVQGVRVLAATIVRLDEREW